MPKFTIELSAKAVTGLQTQVTRTNENEGSAYTLQQWITLHLNELAITDELGAAVAAIQEQQQRDAQAALDTAVRTARDQLLAEL